MRKALPGSLMTRVFSTICPTSIRKRCSRRSWKPHQGVNMPTALLIPPLVEQARVDFEQIISC